MVIITTTLYSESLAHVTMQILSFKISFNTFTFNYGNKFYHLVCDNSTQSAEVGYKPQWSKLRRQQPLMWSEHKLHCYGTVHHDTADLKYRMTKKLPVH
jgi:hypothetical protein